MIYEKLLSIDLSTTATGYALFGCKDRDLLSYGVLKNTTKGMSKMKYPEKQLHKMLYMAKMIKALILKESPTRIVIEEITGSKNRLTQKTLDGMHYVLIYIIQNDIDFKTLAYYDVSGSHGWRTDIKLNLSSADKAFNTEAKKLNRKLARKDQIVIIGKKHLACAHANRNFSTSLDYNQKVTDGDIADAICIGSAFLEYRL